MTIPRLALAAAATTLTFPAIAATQDELREALVGNTFQGDMSGGGYSSYFADDGTYYDTDMSGVYEITDDGVCYPDTDFGCYQATLDGTVLEWIKDGASSGTGEILEGDALDLSAE